MAQKEEHRPHSGRDRNEDLSVNSRSLYQLGSGGNVSTGRLQGDANSWSTKNVVEVGFEPMSSKRLDLESSTLDLSAIQPGRVQNWIFWSAARCGKC